MKTILITGAATGIGESLAKLLSNNNKLILTYHQSIPDKIPGADYYQIDITNNESIVEFFNKIKNKYSTIDVLVNNAAICLDKLFLESSFTEIDQQINTNLSGLIKMTYQFLPIIREKIINIGSECSKITYPEYSIYCATKFGVRGFTQALATEATKLKIYCANPGPTSTKMNGFYGTKPEEVAEIIFNNLIESSKLKSGSDLDIYKMFDIK